MDIAPPPGPGSRIQELGDRLIVRFRPNRSWGEIGFLVFWVTFWTFGGIAAFAALPGAAGGERAFLLLWLCGWAFGEYAALRTIAWQFVGQELLIVTDQRLEVRKEIGRFARVKLYDVPLLHDIEAARVPSGEDEQPRKDFCLRLSYDEKTIRIGEGMGEREAEHVASVVLSKIRPRPRWGDESAADPWGDNDQGRVAAVGDFDREPAGFHANFAIAAVALVLVVGGGVLLLAPHQKHSASRTSRPDPRPLQAPSGPPSPEEFSDPRAYAAALTRDSLGSGGTNVLDRPDCGSRLTWTDWTCTVRAKATNGPFVGVVLTYRCYPIGHGVLCGPKNPPPLVAAGGS